MISDLQDVISAAVDSSQGATLNEMVRRRRHLQAVPDYGRAGVATAVEQATPSAASPEDDEARSIERSGDRLGRNGLRLAFWLCGFHEALNERRRAGEQLTDKEESLITLSRKDFGRIREMVIAMAVERLDEVVNAPDVIGDRAGNGTACPAAFDRFAVDAVRSFAQTATRILRENGADAALRLFGADAEPEEPLAIFQTVFVGAIGLVEALVGANPGGSGRLALLADALEREIERT